jgi:thiamine pyrophosphokinase
MRITLIANGNINDPSALQEAIEDTDMIIAVDGGAKHCSHLGIGPDAIIGDMDSLSTAAVDEYKTQGIDLIRHPVEKDATDLELSLDFALEKNPTAIHIWGAVGSRWDMSVANLMLLALPKYSYTSILIEDENQQAKMLIPGQINRVESIPGAKLSLIPLCGDVTGVITRGLKYSLESETLYFGQTRGVSNEFETREATITYVDGLLLCIIFKSKIEI